MESRRVRMLSRTDSAVALALVQRQEEDAAAARAQQAEWATYTHMVMMARDFSDLDEMIGRLQAIESRHNFIEQLAPHGSHQGDRKRLSYDGSVRKDRGRHPRLWRQLCPVLHHDSVVAGQCCHHSRSRGLLPCMQHLVWSSKLVQAA